MADTGLVSCLFERLKKKRKLVVFAESLTGGLIASELSKIPGSSTVFWGSFVTYNTFAKEKVLCVPHSTIETFGVISKECAISMAEGALKVSFAMDEIHPTYALAVTGLAGPPTREDVSKVGTVYIATSKISRVEYLPNTQQPFIEYTSKYSFFCFEGDRNNIREQTLNNGIKMLLEIL